MSARHTVEVELKFDVKDGARVPDLAALVPDGSIVGPTSYELSATYYDTATHDLAANRITLRRRTGGTDAGWHLKRPAATAMGAAARRELQLDFADAPADGDVPDTLREPIMAIVRDRPLVPIAELGTERVVTILQDADGNSLAEFCADQVLAYDHGAAHSTEWTEWEFELTGGDADLLKAASRLLRGAGARKARSASKLARAIGSEPEVHPARPDRPAKLGKHPTGLELVLHSLAAHRDSLLRWDPLMRENADDSVHQMRVTARKLRALLTSFPTVVDPARTGLLISEFRELGVVLSDARDREVLLASNSALLDSEPTVPDELRHALIDVELRRHDRAVRAAMRAMSTERYLRLLDALDELIVDPTPGPDAHAKASSVALAGIAHAARRLDKAERALNKLDPWSHEWVEQMHRVRKRAKAVRYTAEAAAPLRLAKAAKIARHAENVQGYLGDFQDSIVHRAQFARLSQSREFTSAAHFVLGRLDARVEEAGRAAAAAYLAD